MRVAVLGLGRMGNAVAKRLAAAGYELSVYNRSPAASTPFAKDGHRVLRRPADAFNHADIAITMLADDTALRAVTLGDEGLFESDRRGTLVDMSTVSTRCSAEVGAAAAVRDIGYLRAPVSGNPSVLAAGNLTIIASGPRTLFDAASPTLLDIGPNLFYVGAGEEARVAKLALNLMLGGVTQLLAEALVLGEHHGIDARTMLEVIGGSAVASPYVRYKTDALVAGDYRSTFTARLLYKDLTLALEAGHETSVPLPLTAATQQLVEGCIATGMGDLDLSVLLPRLRRDAGGADVNIPDLTDPPGSP